VDLPPPGNEFVTSCSYIVARFKSWKSWNYGYDIQERRLIDSVRSIRTIQVIPVLCKLKRLLKAQNGRGTFTDVKTLLPPSHSNPVMIHKRGFTTNPVSRQPVYKLGS
jgi:hypothetical protein